jgi:hypothetical protein
MRYRSATVADSHGLPCVSGTDEKNKTAAIRTPLLVRGKRLSCAFFGGSFAEPVLGATNLSPHLINGLSLPLIRLNRH